ncbi:hypothetical protein BSL82_11980 [Tardibacter chloracetimidivorans]|uniref:HTH araC/xylS-type domain-containing protein n=1 Tax=Tardibacter chloracetimidivorans TaxID=1921510 RepID=A0A1L3ZWF5_9SPHN|nr:AraC family transcriptional regulator [Tardibacter chloracetimidivorans]API59940.1 hypothetical protein BSL82_11980 [Tardibacter chloracetimidivorans]
MTEELADPHADRPRTLHGVRVEAHDYVPKRDEESLKRLSDFTVSWWPGGNRPDAEARLLRDSGPGTRMGRVTALSSDEPVLIRYHSPRPLTVVTFSYSSGMLATILRDGGDRISAEQLSSFDIDVVPLAATMRDLAREALQSNLGGSLAVEALATWLLIQLARTMAAVRCKPFGRVGGLAGWQLKRIRERLAEVDCPLPRMGELAELVDLSAGHLSRAYRASEGQCLHREIADIRLARSCDLLRHSGLSIGEIGARLGFRSANGFTLAFRRETGETPRAYRRRAAPA